LIVMLQELIAEVKKTFAANAATLTNTAAESNPFSPIKSCGTNWEDLPGPVLTQRGLRPMR
jgi:hypothetical protein